jgi:hypothetical protein
LVGECFNRKKFTTTTSSILTWFQPFAWHPETSTLASRQTSVRPLFPKKNTDPTFGHQTVSIIPVPLSVTPQDSFTNPLLPTYSDPTITFIDKHYVVLISWECRNFVSVDRRHRPGCRHLYRECKLDIIHLSINRKKGGKHQQLI